MTLPDLIRATRWMIYDTYRQSLASKLFWVILAVTAVCTLLAFSIEVSGDPPRVSGGDIPAILPKEEAERLGEEKLKADGIRVASGEFSLGFGAFKIPLNRSRDDAVRFVQVTLAAGVADTFGVLLAILWTAGFMPTFLAPQSATVLMAKPTPRWTILVGKYLGVVLFVTFQAFVFIAATWLAFGVRTDVWTGAYWLAVPLLVVNFAIFYAVSTFLAVWTRSTAAAAFGTLLFWLLCWAINFTHHRLGMMPPEGLGALSSTLAEIAYWIFPKPLDLAGLFFESMGGKEFSTEVPELTQAREAGRFHPELSAFASLGFAAVVLGLAGYELEMTDY